LSPMLTYFLTFLMFIYLSPSDEDQEA
jgi:hypothetical protein